MKRLTLLLLLLSFWGCASSAPKSEEGLSDLSLPNMTSEVATSSAESVEPKSQPLPLTSTTASAANAKSSGSALDEAIKSQNDDSIQRQASVALGMNPRDIKALNALALVNYKRGRFTAAKFLLNKSIQIQESPEAFNNLGVLHLALGEEREATLAFRQALKLNSQDGAAAANIGAIFVSHRDFSKAAVALETAYQKGYRDIRVLNNYAIALTGQGKGSQAQALYEKALKDQNNQKELLFNYSILLIDHLKKFKDGIETLNRLKFVGVSSEQKARIKELENKAKIGLQ